MKVKNTGSDHYHGWDQEARRGVTIAPGAVAEVSPARGERMLRDYPGRFELVIDAPSAPAADPLAAPPRRKRGRA